MINFSINLTNVRRIVVKIILKCNGKCLELTSQSLLRLSYLYNLYLIKKFRIDITYGHLVDFFVD